MSSFGYVACDRRRFERLFFQTNIRIDAAINDLRRPVFRKASTVLHFMSMGQSLPVFSTTAEEEYPIPT